MDELIAKAKQGDQASIERLVADYTGLIRAIANKVYVVGGDKDDLLQEGMLGLFFAITNYDETKGAFPSYAKLCVKGRIADAVRKYVNDKNKPLADYIDIASIEQMTDESTPLTDLIVKEQAEKIISNSFTMLLLFSVVLTIVFYAAAPTLLRLFGASDTTLPYALAYSRIYILGTICVLIVLGMNTFITAQGFAKISMLTTVIGAVINIVLDPILIFGLGMGVKGAAIATVLSQAVGAIWVIRFLTGPKTILKIRKEDMKLEGKIIMPVLALGISTFVMLSTESLLSISFSSSLARYGGDVAVGAMTVITSASQLCTMPISGICQGGQPVMSFNFGAGKKDRVKQAFRFQLTLCLSYTTIFWLLMMLVPGAVAGIFTSDASLIDYTTWAMRIYMAGIFSTGVQIACQQSFMALGQAKVSLLLACLRKLILLIPLIFILPHVVANPVFGVFLAEPVSDIIAATVTATTFFLQFNKILDKGAGRV